MLSKPNSRLPKPEVLNYGLCVSACASPSGCVCVSLGVRGVRDSSSQRQILINVCECFLQVSHCPECFIDIDSFHPATAPLRRHEHAANFPGEKAGRRDEAPGLPAGTV